MTTTKERPILFSGEMVRAILEGRKTQTRRVVKPQPVIDRASGSVIAKKDGRGFANWLYSWPIDGKVNDRFVAEQSRYGVPGDRLWVREAFRFGVEWDDNKPADVFPHEWADNERHTGIVHFEADGKQDAANGWGKLRPGIFMPRWASRITLEVTGVRVERLQDISEADCAAEGIATEFHGMPVGGLRWEYAALWDRINGAGSWDANPWVWVVEFKRVGGAA